MKKYLKIILMSIMILVFATVLFACEKKGDEQNGKPVYNIEVRVDGEKLTCRQTVVVTNTFVDKLSGLTFGLYPNAFNENSANPGYVGRMERYGGIEIEELTVNGSKSVFSLSENAQYMSFGIGELDMGKTVEVGFEYSVDLPEGNFRLSKCGEIYNLSEFYPQLTIFDGEKFREDPYCSVGDPVVSYVADFCVKLDVPRELVAAVPGKISVEEGEERNVITSVCENFRDFAVCLNPSFEVAKATCGDIEVEYYRADFDGKNDVDGQKMAEFAASAVGTFSENFGEYPYSRYVLAVTPFDAGGMEYSGLVYIGADDETEETVLHETAHQWWYNLVGNDNVNDPWLDEGLAEYSAILYRRLVGEEERYCEDIENLKKSYGRYERLQKLRQEGNLSMTKSIYDYTEYQYGMLVYEKGALLFDHLSETVGKEDFIKTLRGYVKDNRFKIASSDGLKRAFIDHAGYDISGLIDGWLSPTAVVAVFD